MELKELLAKVDSFNSLKVEYSENERYLRRYDSVQMQYNELTFIPFFRNHKVNVLQKNHFPLERSIEKLIATINAIKNTQHDKISDRSDIIEHATYVKPEYSHNKYVSEALYQNAALNEAWHELYTIKFNFDDTFSDKLIKHKEQVKILAASLEKTYSNFNKFLFSYHVLNDQLVKSFLNPEDKTYVIGAINKLVNKIPDIDDICRQFEEYNTANQTYVNLIKSEIAKTSPNYLVSQAVQFIGKESNIVSESSLEQFLHTKEISEHVIGSLEFTSNQKINKVLVFKDNSIAYKKDNVYHTVSSNEELVQFTADIHMDAVNFLLRKKPKSIPFFQEKMLEDKHYGSGINTLQALLEHHLVLKQYNFDLNDFKKKSFEAIDDKINSIVYRNKIKQFAYSILSAKTKHFYNDDTEPHFKALYDNNLTTSQLQNFVGKKIAAMHSNEDIIQMLKGVLNQFNEFTKEITDMKLESFNIEKLYDANDMVIFEVKNYEQCKFFGSKSWCIVRDEYYFDDYVSNPNNKQYVVYDFSKPSTDNYSMIGFTITQSGSYHAEHLKNDDMLEDYDKSPELKIAQQYAIYLNKDNHNMSEDTINSLIDDLAEAGLIKKSKNNLKQRLV